MKLKRVFGAAVSGCLALFGLGALATPAGATVKVGAINCTATAPIIGTTNIQNPSTSYVTGPNWVAKSTAFKLVNHGASQVLPSAVSIATIGSYVGISNTTAFTGVTGTSAPTVAAISTSGKHNDGFFYYDNDLSTPGDEVKMDGVGGHPAAPVIAVAPNGITPSSWLITVTFPGTLNVAGTIGSAIFSPDVETSVANSGTADGPISVTGASTALTANITAPIVGAATTSCTPSAVPQHTVHVHTSGSPANKTEPVVACSPAAGTKGTYSVSKGFFSGAGGTGGTPYAAGSAKAAVTYDGCVAPDQQANAWVSAKQGPAAAAALTLAKAAVSLKGKNFGDCKNVDIRDASGQHHATTDPAQYQMYGTAAVKWQTSLGAAVAGAGPSSATVALRTVINQNGYSPLVTLEANGVVTKGFGAGGPLTFVGEIDTTALGPTQLLGCNGIGGAAPANVYIGAAKPAKPALPGLPLLTGPDATLEIGLP